MSASKAPELVDWLLAELPAVLAAIDRPAGRAVEIHEGWPGDIVQCDTVVIGDHRIVQSEKELSARHRKEDVVIEVEILTVRGGGTATEARQAAYEIADAINERMRGNPSGITLGGAACRARSGCDELLYGMKDRTRSGWLRCTLVAHEERL